MQQFDRPKYEFFLLARGLNETSKFRLGICQLYEYSWSPNILKIFQQVIEEC
jgi:hypothetical protein